MNVIVTPAPLSGTVTAPVSKSCVHRLLICAATGLRERRLVFDTSDLSEDILATVRCLEALGAVIRQTEDGVTVTPIDRSHSHGDAVLDCGESGSTLRFLIPVAAALGGTVRFLLRGRLPERPLSPLWEELERHGVTLRLEGDMLTVCGDGMSGGTFRIDGGVSSQFISGLLLALPLLPRGQVTVTGRMESRPYIDMTLGAMEISGVPVSERDGVFTLKDGPLCDASPLFGEGDWSGASFWVMAGAFSPQGVTVTGLDTRSLQGDRVAVDIIGNMGAVVETLDRGVRVRAGEHLRGLHTDASLIPDLVPVLAAVSSAAEGDTLITGVSRLRLKESDRIESTCRMITRLGRTASGDDLAIRITGGPAAASVPLLEADSAGDHRIAMAAAILATVSPVPVRILGGECVKKSYPRFWEDFALLGGRLSFEE